MEQGQRYKAFSNLKRVQNFIHPFPWLLDILMAKKSISSFQVHILGGKNEHASLIIVKAYQEHSFPVNVHTVVQKRPQK